MTKFSVGLIVTAVFCVACSGSRELTRDRAAELIQAHEEFNAPYTVHVSIDGPYVNPSNWFAYLDPSAKARQHLLNLEYAVVDPRTNRFSLTPFGQEAAKTWLPGKHPYGGDSSDYRAIPVAARKFGAITGIAKDGDEGAIAEFTYEWRLLSRDTGDLQMALYIDSTTEVQRERMAKPHSAAAVLALYDDGWRVTELRLEDARQLR